MTTHRRIRKQSLRCAPVALAVWLLLTALPALAAQIVEVRVGNHPDFTRVVFELDGMAGYRVETREGAKPELIVTIDASSRVRKIISKSDGIAAVEVTPQGSSAVAHISLRKPGIRLKEMILTNPSRIVLDLMSDKPAPVAKTPPVKPKPAVEQPAPTPKPIAKQPAPTPKPVAKQPVPTPTPVAKQPVPAPIVTAKTDPPEPDADPEAIAKALGNALAAAIKPSPDTPAAPPAAEAPKPGAPTAAHPTPTRAVPKPVVQPATPKPQPVAKSTPPPAKSGSDGEASGGTPFAIIAGAGAGILLCVVGLVVLLRRRSPQSNDLDAPTIAEGVADPDAEQRSFTDMVFNETDSPSEESPIAGSATSDLDSFFDKDDDAVLNPGTKGGDVMNQGISDLPVKRDGAGAKPSVPPRASTSPDPDVLRVVHELERRMAQLETKLGESDEARERLERQVAAQSEELRVQRAAIARTQRALRSLSRGEEEKATEPALRDDETQAKTRINV